MHEFMQNTVMRHASCVMQITDTQIPSVLVYAYVCVGVFTRTPFLPIPPGGFNFSVDGALVDAGCISQA